MKTPRALTRRTLRLILPLLVTAALAACGDGEGEPVGRLAATPETVRLPHGTFAEIELRWNPLTELDGETGPLRVLVHLLDGDGSLARTFDFPFGEDWRPGGETVHTVRLYQSMLAPPLPAKTYSLSAGLYDAAGKRWPLTTTGEARDRGEYVVASVEVPADGAAPPAVAFDAAWSPILAGADRQVLAMRWLEEDGGLTVGEAGGAGTLWAQVRVPQAGTEGLVARMDEGVAGEEPRVVARSGCGGFEAEITGAGGHALDFPVPAGSAGCEISFDSNYVLRAEDGVDRGSLVVEVLAWRAVAGR